MERQQAGKGAGGLAWRSEQGQVGTQASQGRGGLRDSMPPQIEQPRVSVWY